MLSAGAAGQDVSIAPKSARCKGGMAAFRYPCQSIDLLAHFSLEELFALHPQDARRRVSDIWGWTDALTGHEYALVGLFSAVAFVDVTDPVHSTFLGILPSADGAASRWRDMKVYGNHMFVVVDGSNAKPGLQVFDLTQLRGRPAMPGIFAETARYTGFDTAHNIAINEDTGFAYVTGSRGTGSVCTRGLHMVDIRDPAAPVYAGCFLDITTGQPSPDGYTHDAQCVTYRGPDRQYVGREICIGANINKLSIADVTDKARPVALAATPYPHARYAHQGWLTEDHRYFVMNDELDEIRTLPGRHGPRTLIWDIAELEDPVLATEYFGTTGSIDHNLHIHRGYAFEANYTSGLRIVDLESINSPREAAFFDTYPDSDQPKFAGAWGVYPFFESGTIVVSSIGEGLFVLKPAGLDRLAGPASDVGAARQPLQLSSAHPNPFHTEVYFSLALSEGRPVRIAALDVLGREVSLIHEGPLAAGTYRFRLSAGTLPSGRYIIRAASPDAERSLTVTRFR